jgi:hypothetical protein
LYERPKHPHRRALNALNTWRGGIENFGQISWDSYRLYTNPKSKSNFAQFPAAVSFLLNAVFLFINFVKMAVL